MTTACFPHSTQHIADFLKDAVTYQCACPALFSWNSFHLSEGGPMLWCHWWVLFTNPIQNQSAIFKPKAWLEVFILVSSTHPKQLWIHTILSVMSHIYEFSVHLKKEKLAWKFWFWSLSHIPPKYLGFYDPCYCSQGHQGLLKELCKVCKFTSWLGTRSASAKHDSKAKPWDIEGLKQTATMPQKADIFYDTKNNL